MMLLPTPVRPFGAIVAEGIDPVCSGACWDGVGGVGTPLFAAVSWSGNSSFGYILQQICYVQIALQFQAVGIRGRVCYMWS